MQNRLTDTWQCRESQRHIKIHEMDEGYITKQNGQSTHIAAQWLTDKWQCIQGHEYITTQSGRLTYGRWARTIDTWQWSVGHEQRTMQMGHWHTSVHQGVTDTWQCRLWYKHMTTQNGSLTKINADAKLTKINVEWVRYTWQCRIGD